MEPLEIIYDPVQDEDFPSIYTKKLNIKTTLQAIIDRVNEQQKFLDILSKEIGVLNGMDD